ncbi:MAG: MFS transporter [Candidatus Binatus sp.]|uniref:MFS transporter n=1 Tax=Candidatus Binatus sp. TaxID=2811406 RepID=UPI003C767E85
MRAVITDAGVSGAAESREPIPSLELFDSPRAWRMVAAAFVAMCAVYGVAYSFGAFFKPMAAEFGADRSATSAVFSITVLIWCCLGPITGHLSDRFGPRIVVATGALFMGLGLALTSVIDRLWLGYLSYGLGVGVGVACAYVPMVAVVGGWFLRRRNTALGIAVAGIGFGTVCGAPIAAALIAHLGWRATYVAFAIATTAILLGCAWIVERPPVHVTPSRVRLADAVRSPAFAFLYASSVTVSTVIFVPLVYLPSFARDRGASEFAGAALVGVIGGASVAGRMGLGSMADRVGVVRLYQASFLVLALSYGLWLIAASYPMMVVFALVMGAGYGGYVALSPAVIAHLFGTQRMGSLLGVLYTSGGIGAMAGPPVVGLIIDRTGSYRVAIAAAFVVALVSFALLIPLTRFEPAATRSSAAID